MPHDHFYRHLERTLDLSFVREFFEGLRSERLLMRHAADRLSVRWYVGYDLGEPLPDHSSLTRIRERYGVDIFRRFAGEDCGAVPTSRPGLGARTVH